MRNLTGKLLFIIGSIFLANASFAQGTLSGKVVDSGTGEALIGANVFIVGTYKGSPADYNGEYTIEDIKPGDYTIKVTYLGFNEKQFNGIRIKKNQTTTLNIKLEELGTTLETVVIVGEKNLVDLESGKSQVKISAGDIQEMNVRNVQEVVAMQAGVTQNPDGIQIRGGRVYETSYIVEGISAADPLSGTGTGVEVASGSIQDIELITGGGNAEYGGSTSGVILTRIREGGNKYSVTGGWQRDNLGFNDTTQWNTDIVDLGVSGPIPYTNKKASFFTSANMLLTDNYFGPTAGQLRSSLFEDETTGLASENNRLFNGNSTNQTLWAPRQANKWSHTLKLSYNIQNNTKLTITNQHSLNINQSTRSLQIVGNDAIITPGYQYFFSRDLNNANTYTHQSNLTAMNFSHVFKDRIRMETSVGRLFVNLRADANGRPFREETVSGILDASSIVSNPIDLFNPQDSIVFVLPGPGLANNNGIASLWHDHYVEEYTIKNKFKYISKNNTHFYTFGLEHKFQEYQWIDVTAPWVGAPIQINDTLTTPLISIGSSSDVWKVKPQEGGIFVEDQIKYKGLIATFGVLFKYWAPGKFVDDVINDPESPVLDQTRADYERKTVPFAGLRWKARLLPKLNVSFPITENNVLYFNYGHSMRLAHPRFVYQGLDKVFQNRSFLSNLGNPDIDPEVSVSYEIGLKSQITRDLAFTVTAFYNDRFDYIVSRRIQVKDQTGQFVEKTFYINQDYARIRGIELGFNQRIGKWFRTNASFAYQIATGKSNTAAESALQINTQGFVNATEENYLAWDRPFEFKAGILFKPDTTFKIGKVRFNNFKVFLSGNWKSGLRYTPFVLTGTAPNGRPQYERVVDAPFEEIGKNWFWMDLKISRDIPISSRSFASLSFEVKNLLNNKNSQIINPVTGRAYEFGDPLPITSRDPLYPDPSNNSQPPFNPARFMQPRQILAGISFQF
jgi:outer membrane receptor protein involved in Fe transport